MHGFCHQSITHDRIPYRDRDRAGGIEAEPEQFELQRHAATRSRSFIMFPPDHQSGCQSQSTSLARATLRTMRMTGCQRLDRGCGISRLQLLVSMAKRLFLACRSTGLTGLGRFERSSLSFRSYNSGISTFKVQVAWPQKTPKSLCASIQTCCCNILKSVRDGQRPLGD